MADRTSVVVVLPAAGSGQRFSSHANKLFAPLRGKPLWTHSVDVLSGIADVERFVLVVSQPDRTRFEQEAGLLATLHPIEFVIGGRERSDSVTAAIHHLRGIAPETLVAIHDAARPCVRAADIASVIVTARCTGAAILATPVVGTVKKQVRGVDNVQHSQTIDRRDLFVALTPQVFRYDVIARAVARHRGSPVTDDAQLVERSGHPVTLVAGAADNLKITYPEDLLIAAAILESREPAQADV